MDESWFEDQEDQLQEGPQGVTSGPLRGHGEIFLFTILYSLFYRRLSEGNGQSDKDQLRGMRSIEVRQAIN